MPEITVNTLLAPFPLVRQWFTACHEGRQPSPPRTKAAALLMLHHAKQKAGSAYSLEAIAKAVGTTAGAISVRNTDPRFFELKWEQAYYFGDWVLSRDFDPTHVLQRDVDELKRTINHLAPMAARAIYEFSICLHYDALVDQYHEDGHPEDLALLPEIGARCASRAYANMPLTDILVDAVAVVLAKPEEERLGHGDELREVLRRQTQSTKALRDEVRELRAEIAQLKRMIKKSGTGSTGKSPPAL